jgi:hypothetical protein
MSDTSVLDRSPSTDGANGAAGRDQRGFRKDNDGTANPFGRKVAALRAALIASITPADVQRVMTALLVQAEKGNVPAMRLYLAYAAGKPAAAVNPDRVDVEEWQLLQQTVARPEEIAQTFQNVPVPLVSKLANATLPVMADEWADQLAARLKTPVAQGPDSPAKDAQPSANRIQQSAVSAQPTTVPVPESGQTSPAPRAQAAPSPSTANGRTAPSPTGVNGRAAPSAGSNARECAPTGAEPPCNRGLTPLDSPDLRTLRRLARLSGRTGT